MSNIEIAFENPWLLLLAIPAFAIILIPFLLLPKKRRKTVKKIVPVVLHMIIATLLILVLSGFTVVRNSDEQAVMILVDLSDSTENVQSDIVTHTDELLGLIDKNTPVGVIVFGADQLYSVELDSERTFSLTQIDAGATDIDAALEYAVSLLPSDKAGHIILLTDGKETDGDADNTAHYLATQGIRIDAVYYDTTTLSTEETQISSFTAPDGAYVGDEVTFAAEIKSNFSGEAILSLYDNDNEVSRQNIIVPEGSSIVELKATAEDAGIHSYRLVLSAEADTLSQNNESYAYLKVDGEATVLIIADTISHATTLESVLAAENTVTTVTAQNAPDSIIELCNYDEIILSNVDYNDLPSGYDTLLDTYVGVYGRSLLAVGGTETYMYGNMEGTALEEILPVTFSLSESSEGNSVALMLVLDCSNSMSQQSTYLSVAKQGAIKCVEAMSDNDYVGVISFNSTAYLKSELIEANESNKNSLTRIISGLTTNRGTYYTEALEMAHEELLKSNAAVKHIIFLSDGQPSDYGYSEAVQNAAADGISVSTIGLGYASSILESMAESADGRYYYVSSASDLPNIMLSETEQVTVSSLITGEFVPIINEKSELTDSLGTTSLPSITGYLGTTIKDNATAYITTEEGHPIYASWTYGLGTIACFTSDLYGNWSSTWLSDSVGKAMTAKMVETTVADVHHDSSFAADITVRGMTTDILVTTSGSNTENVLSLTVASKNGSKDYVLTHTDPGVYETSIVTEESGIYEIMITETDSSNNIVDYLETAVAVSYSAEYDAFADSGEVLLSNICGYSDGKIFVDMNELAKVKVSAISLIFNPMVLFAVLAMILLLADIAIRKLRWKDIRGYLIKFSNANK